MSTLAERIGQGCIGEDAQQTDKQISINGINGQSMKQGNKVTPTMDITREQWFWDNAVMS